MTGEFSFSQKTMGLVVGLALLLWVPALFPSSGLINKLCGCEAVAQEQESEQSTKKQTFVFGDEPPQAEQMMMEGIRAPYRYVVPTMMALTIIILLMSIRLRAEERQKYFKGNFLKSWFKAMLLKRETRFIFQIIHVFIFFLVIVAGIWGVKISGRNITTVLTWNIWWVSIIFAIMFLGKIWCFVCPWQAVADWLKYLTFWRAKEPVLCLNKKWPKRWRNIYIAAGMFIGLTWLELGYGITAIPLATAFFAILMLGITIVPNLIYERGAFCKYACLVGRISGLYAMFTPMELRATDKGICKNVCQGKDCLMGNEKGYPCPTSMYLGSMELNTYCILCAECIKTCPHDNVSISVRPFAQDLVKSVRTKIDESYLAIIMFSLSYFHAMTMMPLWEKLIDGILEGSGLPFLGAFTVVMVVIMALPVVVYFLFTEISRKLAGDREVSAKTVFVNYAYSLLPITLFFHLAHNAAHLFMEGGRIVAVVSDPLGFGWNIFGTAQRETFPLLTMASTFTMQLSLVYIGLGFSIYIAYRVGMKTFETKAQARKSLVPMVAFLTGLAILGVWLLSQPMVHRTGL